MAFVKKTEEEKDKVLQGQEGEGVVQLNTGTGALQPGGTAEDIDTTVGKTQGAAPTGGQNVSEQQGYLDVNKQKALDMAQSAGNIIREDITGAQTGLTDSEKAFQEAVNAGTVYMDQGLYGDASRALVDQTNPNFSTNYLNQWMGGTYKDATQAQGYDDWYAAQEAAPVEGEQPDYQTMYDEYLTGFTPEEAVSNQQAFQNLYNARYGGPDSILGEDYYTEAMRALSKAERTRGKIEDAEGRQSILGRTYDPSARVTRGTLALDEALLSGYDETMDELTKAAAECAGLQAQNEAVLERAAELVRQGKSTTEATKQAMREQFNLTGEEQEIRDRTSSIKSQAQRDYENYLNYIQNTYGVQEGVQATSYFDRPQDYQNIQAQNVMSAADVARMKALEELTGSAGTLTPFSDQAGQYTNYTDPSADFRRSDFESKVASERDARLAREEAERQRLEAIRQAEEEARRAQEEADKKAKATAIGAAVGATAGAIVGSIVPGIGTAAGAVVGGAIGGVVGSVFCFDGETEFLMVNGIHKAIKDIEIGDVLKDGGKVYSISKHVLSSPLYSYPTADESSYIWVTGNHAVKEDGKWIRICESRKATPVYEHEVETIYSLSCENHIMISHGVVLADYEEVENSQGLTDHQCLNVLNQGEVLNVC